MKRNLTILIAEDNEDDIYLLQRALRKIGAANPIQAVKSGQEALDYLRGEGVYKDRAKFPFPSILITDLKMPLKSGFEVLKWLRAHPECNVVPVIVLTSSKEDRDIKEAYQLGANAYLVKPANFADLETMMRSMSEFWGWCEKPKMPIHC